MEGSNYGEADKCPTCHRFLTSLKWLPPFFVELESWGKKYGDIVGIGYDLIVSGRFKEAFAKEVLRGLENFEPVTVPKVCYPRGKTKELIPCYYKASVKRGPASIDQDASGYEGEDKTKVCQDCLYGKFKRHRRLLVKESTWNGDDIFFPRGGNGKIVSERFRSVFNDRGFLGAIFIPVEDYGYDYYPWETTITG